MNVSVLFASTVFAALIVIAFGLSVVATTAVAASVTADSGIVKVYVTAPVSAFVAPLTAFTVVVSVFVTVKPVTVLPDVGVTVTVTVSPALATLFAATPLTAIVASSESVDVTPYTAASGVK